MELYILPMPLAPDSIYWLYPQWEAVVQRLEHFFVERAVRVRGFLERWGKSPTACLYEYDPQLQDWRWEAYEAVFGQRHPAALLSEAGLPGVADPGHMVVRRAHAEGYQVIPLAGPSSITLALAASGLRGQSFAFRGYPPLPPKERRRFLQEVFQSAHHTTQILMETPGRTNRLFREILQLGPPDLLLCVAHHLTADTAFIQTRPIALWSATPLPKGPTLFLLGK
ncbi:MAG: SAM-dependent methyltransferase [Bacteroidia bacterium]|nr:SAM-dependent methyltransferase [Bacteroidia bacterium]MDW8089226.1 SAM-dependent methyltransferase [Bacteroidia bacterium]